ncbi:hypothetical protein CC78DRAFT_553995 [Lojkania enalia]|uniref:HNH domain-containing protein n=1 Tax=Lojkania enalia TaxID=147567 RepID=A0A9P4K9F4_9PLEO|nr:hypothetical protein CC78DRAFT_553995 [Didymosphaeria enalia]
MEHIPTEQRPNYSTFRECLSDTILRNLCTPVEKTKKRKRAHRKKKSKEVVMETASSEESVKSILSEETGNDAEELGEFIDYLATLIFPSLPADLRTLSYSKYKESVALQDAYSTPLSASTSSQLISTMPPTALDDLTTYSLLPSPPDTLDLHNLFNPILSAYITSVTSPPPIWSTTRASACELCQRSWIPLTYHHLIPRSTHVRALKRGWHTEDKLNSVAWLCRACHSFVHQVASNEELAKDWYTVELLESRDDVRGWVRWVGRVRWKSR